MEQNEMTNNEVMEIAEEIVNVGTGRGLKMFGFGVATVVVSGVAYKYAVKPLIKKIKNKKEAKTIEMCEEYDSVSVDDTEYFDQQ